MNSAELSECRELESTDLSTELNGVVIGVLVGFDFEKRPKVSFMGCSEKGGVLARTIVPLLGTDIGRQVALLFEGGEVAKPLILGRLHLPKHSVVSDLDSKGFSIEVDGETVCFSAQKEIVLRCGKASIVLTRAGKILIRGAYISSGSTGANKVRGATVQIN